MQTRVLLLLLAGSMVLAAPAQDATNEPVATVQRLFDAMAAHDVEMARTVFTPEATLLSVRADGTPANTPHEQFIEHLGSSKDAWLERIWNPRVLIHGSIAVVWADYDFHLNGKLHHCGVDSINLLKTSAGWKISGIAYTSEVSTCVPSPLGPPEAAAGSIKK